MVVLWLEILNNVDPDWKRNTVNNGLYVGKKTLQAVGTVITFWIIQIHEVTKTDIGRSQEIVVSYWKRPNNV